MKMVRDIYREFKNRFDEEPILISAPARVNLIGEHTDYNDGFVLPAAVDKVIVLAMAPNEINEIRIFSMDMDESCEVDLIEDLKKHELNWANYILGVVDQFQKNSEKIGGFDCVFGGDSPIGAGLSSSAALEGGVSLGLSILFSIPVSKLEMAKLSQKAENEFVGMQCGIMDQFASLHGEKGHVLKLDCRSLEYEAIPFRRTDIAILLCDTGIHRELTSSEYNTRRQQCEDGIKILKQKGYEIENLRDVLPSMLEKHKDDLPGVVYERCRFVLDENDRVTAACEDLLKDDFDSFGQLMYQSHYGLRDLYEVSCEELDVLVEIAETAEGVYGSRMMGGGFGGCTINLVQKNKVENFAESVKKTYYQEIGEEIEIYQASISDGTKQISTDLFL